MRSPLKSFCKSFLIGTACICALALVWLCWVRPGLTANEAESLKAAYTTSPGASGSGAGLLPAGKESAPALNFATLQAQYPDIRAWLTIPGTVVDYPVLQSNASNPEYYLRRNHKGEYRTAGSLFFQSDCVRDGRVLVVYGHNMADGTMFGCLPQIMRGEISLEHSNIQLQTADGVHHYRVAAMLETDVSRVPFNRTVFADDADFLKHTQSLLDAAAVKTGIPISANSRLFVLITCSYSWSEARYVVVAVETKNDQEKGGSISAMN